MVIEGVKKGMPGEAGAFASAGMGGEGGEGSDLAIHDRSAAEHGIEIGRELAQAGLVGTDDDAAEDGGGSQADGAARAFKGAVVDAARGQIQFEVDAVAARTVVAAAPMRGRVESTKMTWLAAMFENQLVIELQ